MLVSALALTLGMAASPISAARNAVANSESQGTVVYLGCQVSHAALTDCKVVNDEPVDAGVAGVALKLAEQVNLPDALADHGAGRIVLKFTVKR